MALTGQALPGVRCLSYLGLLSETPSSGFLRWTAESGEGGSPPIDSQWPGERKPRLGLRGKFIVRTAFVSDFEVRISFGLRPSEFGLRPVVFP